MAYEWHVACLGAKHVRKYEVNQPLGLGNFEYNPLDSSCFHWFCWKTWLELKSYLRYICEFILEGKIGNEKDLKSNWS